MAGEYSRLDSGQRQVIEEMINNCCLCKDIAEVLGIDSTTVSREVYRNRVSLPMVAKSQFMRNPCAKRGSCQITKLCAKRSCRKTCQNCTTYFCHERCSEFVLWECLQTERFPFVCNRCKARRTCPSTRYIYDASRAEEISSLRANMSRRGITVDERDIEQIDSIISPLLKKGQSPYHIWVNNREELGISLATLYNYINFGLFSAGRMSLPRAVRFKPRKKKRPPQDQRDFTGRLYIDYLTDMGALPDGMGGYDQKSIVYTGWDAEMDTVIGRIGGKALLTVVLLPSSITIARLLTKKTQAEVVAAIDWLETVFKENRMRVAGQSDSGTAWWFLTTLLTDRGAEVADITGNETSCFDLKSNKASNTGDELRRCDVYYADPYSSYQKPHIEQAHTLIRRVLPKRTSFDDLSQEQLNLICSHVNSYSRKELNGKSPFEVAPAGFSEKLMHALGMSYIAPADINLTKELIY